MINPRPALFKGPHFDLKIQVVRLVGIRDLNNPRVSRRRNRCPVALEPACDGHAMKRLLIFFVLVPIATPENGGREVLQTAFNGATLWCGGMPAGCPPADARPNAMPEPNAPECAFPHAGLRRENQQLLLLLRGIEFMLCVGPRRTSKPCPDSTFEAQAFLETWGMVIMALAVNPGRYSVSRPKMPIPDEFRVVTVVLPDRLMGGVCWVR